MASLIRPVDRPDEPLLPWAKLQSGAGERSCRARQGLDEADDVFGPTQAWRSPWMRFGWGRWRASERFFGVALMPLMPIRLVYQKVSLRSTAGRSAVSRHRFLQSPPRFWSLATAITYDNIQRGWCLYAMGQRAEGLSLLLEGIEIKRAAGFNLGSPAFLTELAEVYEMAGEPRKGLNRLAEAAKLVETTQERWIEAEMHRLRGTLLLSCMSTPRRRTAITARSRLRVSSRPSLGNSAPQ